MTEKSKRAYWKTHQYQRHSVGKDLKTFCGWPVLLELVEACENPLKEPLVSFLFETGGCISEVLALTKNMFSVNESTEPPTIVVSGMPLRKLQENRRLFPMYQVQEHHGEGFYSML